MRSIEVYSSQNNETTTVRFEGTTFGELLDEMGFEAGQFTGAGGTTKTTYVAEDAVISADDDFIAIYPTKMKAGSDNGTRYSDAAVREMHTKITNLVADILGEEPEDLAELPKSGKSSKNAKNAEKAKALARGMGLS